jgi:hypothetical protein
MPARRTPAGRRRPRERTLRQLFDERVPLEGIASVVEASRAGEVEVSAAMPSSEYQDGSTRSPVCGGGALIGGDSPARLASAIGSCSKVCTSPTASTRPRTTTVACAMRGADR